LSEIYGIDKITQPRLRLVQVPTTAGTGSEVTPISIVTTGKVTKSGIVAAQILPDIVILDPELTLGLPPHGTAATGVDAMVHAIEAYTSRHKKNAYSDRLAKEALVLLSANILKATHNGNDVDARMAMLRGACLAGQAFANAPVAAVHALAYPLGGVFHIPHGLSNSLVLPHVMRFTAPEAHTLYADLGPLIIPNYDKAFKSSTRVTHDLIAYLESLIVDLGLPNSLKKMKIKRSDLPVLAHDAMKQTRLLVNNPREVSEVDALLIYHDAFE
jgi:alcohol dehydrogenase